MGNRRGALAEWVRQSGVMLPPVETWTSDTAEKLMGFDELLTGKDTVFLGEMDHFIHEKTDFRLLLIRYLAARGWTRIAEEMSWSDGVRVNRYLSQGEDIQLDRLVGLGYEQDLRTDRNDRPTGMLKASFDAYPVALFRAEQLRFYRGLRQVGAHLDFYGFDVDALPGGAYANIATELEADSDNPDIKHWLTDLTQIGSESVAEEASRLRNALQIWEDLRLDLDPARKRRVNLSLRALIDTLDYIELTYAAADYAALSPGLAYREDILKRQALAVLGDQDNPRTVFMAHALHLLKDDRLGGAAGPAGPGGGTTKSLGHFLSVEQERRVFSVWLIWSTGEDSQPFPDLPRHFSYGEDTLNAALGVFNQPVIFPVQGAPDGLFDHPWKVGHMYNATVDVQLQGQVDAILFLPNVSAMQATEAQR
jgi:erythromycin esterase-like protein